MATALRPDTRRVAEATPAAITAAFLFEAAVSAATARTGEEAGAAAAAAGGGGGDSAAASIDDKVEAADGNVTASKKTKKRRAQLGPPSTAALSHSLALAAGKARIEMSGNSGGKRRKKAFLLGAHIPLFQPLPFSLPFFPTQLSRSSGAPLPRGASHALCSRCGSVLGAGGNDEIAVRPLSRSCRRRRRRAAAAAAATGATEQPSSSSSRRGKNTASNSSNRELNTVVLAVTCGACGQAKRARGFYTRELAEAAAAALRRGGGGGGG